MQIFSGTGKKKSNTQPVNAMIKNDSMIVINEKMMDPAETIINMTLFIMYLWIIIDDMMLVIEKKMRKMSLSATR